MAKTENAIQHEIKTELCKGDTRVFRNNVGMMNGVQFGLCKGSADLIGWKTIEITEDMVGQKVAVFLSVEVKTPNGRIGTHQQKWMDIVNKNGGLALIARSPEEAVEKLNRERR
ncbi:MAG: VRR-NUC domain-containing protein [Alphaproteobacteria bacterium]|nr:VRR-NUC domain-containing protein [Alphaproteobacteria bacterium]